MNHVDDEKSPIDKPEVQTRKRNSYASVPPVQVNDVEDRRCHSNLMERLFAELCPGNVQQEGDLNSMGQLRWSSERVNNLIESELNLHIRMPNLQKFGDTTSRLLFAYRTCLGEKTFILMNKQHLDTIKTLNSLSTRVEKWSTPKSPRTSKSRES